MAAGNTSRAEKGWDHGQGRKRARRQDAAGDQGPSSGQGDDPGVTAANGRPFPEAAFRQARRRVRTLPALDPNGVTARILDALPEPVEGRSSGADRLAGEFGERKAAAAISSRKNRKDARERDRKTYGWRRRVDGSFAKGREFRVVATRCDGTEPGFRATFLPDAAAVAAK